MTTPFAKQIITQAISESLSRVKNNIRDKRSVLIGHPAKGQIIFTDDTESQIFVHNQGDITQGVERISASGIAKELLTYKRAILIRRNDSDVFEFAGVDTQYDEVYSLGTSTQIDQTAVQINQLTYATLQPQTSLILLVKGAMYGDDLVKDLSTPDFITGTVQDTDGANIVVPTTNLKAIGVLVQLNPRTSTLSFKQSAEYPSSTNLRDAYIADLLPIRDGGKRRVGYFELISGATSLTPANVLVVPDLLGDGELWTNPIVSVVGIGSGFQQHAIEQTISSGGLLTVSGEYWVDDQLIIEDGGQLIIKDGGQMVIRSIITDQPSLITASKEVTSDYTIALEDGNIAVDATSGVITITLPPMSTAIGRSFRIGRTNSGGGNVIIEGDSSETINGDLNKTLSAQWSFFIIVAIGTPSVDWAIG